MGALYVRKLNPHVRLAEQVHGGGHERGMRSGTLNVRHCCGFGKALEVADAELAHERKRLQVLRDRLWIDMQANIDGIELNGHPTQRLPHNLSIAIPGVESRSTPNPHQT